MRLSQHWQQQQQLLSGDLCNAKYVVADVVEQKVG
jgi:hypothetical protein